MAWRRGRFRSRPTTSPNPLNNQRGFTLLELVVASALAVLVIVAAFDTTWRGLFLVKLMQKDFDETAELRNAVHWVTRDLRRASAVAGAGPGRLELTAAGGEAVAYALDGGSLVRTEGASRRTVARGLAAAGFSAEEKEGGVLVAAEFTAERGGSVRTAVWVPGGNGT